MNAEQIIKAELDGKFFHLNVEKQKTIVRRVPKNFIPDHTPKFLIVSEVPSVNARQWSEEEDECLIKMFQDGMSYKEMGKALGVATSAAINRYRVLCLRRGLSATRPDLNEKHPDAVCQRVAYLKMVKKWSFLEIGAELLLSRNQVAGLWKRYKAKHLVHMEAA